MQSLEFTTTELTFRSAAVRCMITSGSPSLEEMVARVLMVGPGRSPVCICDIRSYSNTMRVSAKVKVFFFVTGTFCYKIYSC
jgi:hypothetical protein